MFYLFASQIWIKVSRKHGCELKHIVKLLTASTVVNQDARYRSVEDVTNHFDRFFRTREKPFTKTILQKCAEHICIG